MEIGKTLSLSTSHLPQQELTQSTMNDGVSLPFRGEIHHYGAFLFLGDNDDPEADWDGFENLKPIVEYCIENGISFINFDGDAPIEKEFKTFDWEVKR